MELDITEFFNNAAPMDYSASRAEIGDDAGRITWNAALAGAPDYPLLAAPGALDAFRDYAAEFGAWDNVEIDAWTDQEATALLIQFIAGDMRAAGMSADWTADDWEAYAADDSKAGRIYRGDDGRVYYYLGT